MSVFRKVFSNTAVPIAGKLINVIVSIALIKLLTTNLGVEGYGYYITIFEFLAIFAAICDFGIYATTVKELASAEESEAEHILGNVLTIQITIAMLSMLGAGITVALIPNYASTPIIMGVWLATTMQILNSATSTLKANLQASYQIHYATLATVIGKLMRLCWVILVIALLNPGNISGFEFNRLLQSSSGEMDSMTQLIYLVVFGFTLGSVLEFVITHHYSRKLTRISMAFDRSYWKHFLKKAFPYAVAIFLGEAYFRIDAIMLSLMEGPEGVGLYAVAMRLIENGAYIPVIFVNALLPALAYKLKQGHQGEVEDLLKKGWLFMLSLSLAMVLLASLFAVPLTLLFASREFLSGELAPIGSDMAIQVSVWALLFYSLNRLFVFTSLAMDCQSKILIINAIGVAFNLITNLIFIPQYGMIAAAITTVVSEGVVLGLNFYVVSRSIQFKVPGKDSINVIGSALAAFGICGLVFREFMDPESITAMLVLSCGALFLYAALLKGLVFRRYFGNWSLEVK